MRTVGVDFGTSGIQAVVLEKGAFREHMFLPNDPGDVEAALNGAKSVCFAFGYGLPFTKLSDLGEKDWFGLTLKKKRGERVLGYSETIRKLDDSLPVFFAPGVKHLASVPWERKINKLDMGTPDKLCAAVYCIVDQARRLGIGFSETSFVLAEIGTTFAAYLAVENGRVVDGIGGSCSTLGPKSCGFLDGELAYLLGGFDKKLLFTGGAEFSEKPDLVLREAVERDLAKIRVSLPSPREIVLSGSKRDKLEVEGAVRPEFAYAGAYGAAVLADAKEGGKYGQLFPNFECDTSLFDHVLVDLEKVLGR